MKPPLNLLVIALVTVSVFLPSQSFSQSSKKEYDHLLWRISGKGLKGSSYLFGTMHVMDKRAFNFGDSLYAAIEKSDGYAMELHPDSMMSETLNSEDEADSRLVKDIVSAKTFNSARKYLEEKLKQPANKITIKQLRDYYRKWSGLLDPKTGMETIIDAYFYNKARRAGKWVGGIEDVADQLGFFEDYNYEEFLIDLVHNTTKSRKYIDDLIRMYTTEALSEFDSVEKTYITTHPLMVRRNKKMALRIDSLANIRTTFFAVGAAHLPGDSGVVSLLRKRGFKVDPILSTKKIHATAYKFPEKVQPWKIVKSDSGYYTAEFPAEPQKSEISPESETKMYIDLGTLTIYMTKFFITEKIENEKALLENLLNNLEGEDSAISKKPIELNGIKGTELVAKSAEFTFRMRLFQFNQGVYAAIVGGQTSKTINSIDAERFLNAYTIDKTRIAIANKGSEIISENHGFSIKFPGKPDIETGDRETESYVIDRYKYEGREDAYFQVSVKSVIKGLYMTGDSAMLHNYVENLAKEPDYQLNRKRYFKLSGYPAMEADFKVGKDKDALRTKVLYVHRGSKVYIISASNKALASGKILDEFISSFNLKPITKEQNWKLRTDPTGSFKTWVPDHIEFITDSTQLVSTGGIPYFQSYDSLSPTTLYVSRSTYPKLFWAISDTGLLRNEVYGMLRKSDSLLSYTFTKNGACASVDFFVKLADNSNIRKSRLILNADTLYIVYAFVAPEFLETKNYQKFFEDFRIINEKASSTITKRKTAEYLSAVKMADTASIKELKSLFNILEFDKDDLPLLHQAALIEYADSADEETISMSLFDEIAKINDESTIEFVKKTYPILPDEKAHLRLELLRLLASRGERKSFELIADLLNQIPPSTAGAYRLYDKLRDSLPLAKEIFPRLLFLLRNEFALRQTLVLSNDLLEKKHISKTIFDPYSKAIDSIAEIAVLDLKDEDNDYMDYYYPLMNFFAKTNSVQGQQWLKKFLSSKSIKTQYYAAYALLDNKLNVPAAELQKLVANYDYRVFLYEKLKELKKEALFPLQYRNQKAISESELYTNVLDNYELKAKKIEYIGERTSPVDGKAKKFLLYKVTIDTGEGTETRLGIAGAYSLSLQPIVTSSSIIGLFVHEAFDPAKIDAQFKEFLKEKADKAK